MTHEQEERKPTKTLSGKWMAEMRQSMVYVWMRGETALYVGLATGGLTRALDRNHPRITPWELQPTDELCLYVCATDDEARALEIRLIQRLDPCGNVRHRLPHNPGSKRYAAWLLKEA
jgi:hypothetical protein